MLSGAKINESGRSMVEMLGVLAIVGVLSVGGIAGYSKAMSKYKLTKAQDQIATLLMNIRSAYASSPTYAGLDADILVDFNLVSSDMRSGDNLVNAFGGTVDASDCSVSGSMCGDIAKTDGYFGIRFDNLTKEACLSLATADWGSDGMMGIIVNGEEYKRGGTVGSGESATSVTFPLSVNAVADDCDSDTSKLVWVYY